MQISSLFKKLLGATSDQSTNATRDNSELDVSHQLGVANNLSAETLLGNGSLNIRPPNKQELSEARALVNRLQKIITEILPRKILSSSENSILKTSVRFANFTKICDLCKQIDSLYENQVSKLVKQNVSEVSLRSCLNVQYDISIVSEFLTRLSIGSNLTNFTNAYIGESTNLLFKSATEIIENIESNHKDLKAIFGLLEKSKDDPLAIQPKVDKKREKWLSEASIHRQLDLELEKQDSESLDSAPQPLADEKVCSPGEALRKGESFADMCADDQYGNGTKKYGGRIISSNPNFYSFLAVEDVSIITGSDGRIMDIYAYKHEKKSSSEASWIDLLFNQRLVPNISQDLDSSADIMIEPIFYQSSNNVRVELSPAFNAKELNYYNAEGQLLNTEISVEITECRLGSFEFTAANDHKVAKILCRITDAEWQPDSKLFKQAIKALPKFDSYCPRSYRSVIDAIKQSKELPALKAQILYDYIIDRDYYGTHAKEIAQLINNSGSARNEVIASLGAGNCIPFAYHLAFEFLRIGIPAFIIGGSIPNQASKKFQYKPGHAQVLILLDGSWSILDLTKQIKNDLRVDPSAVNSDEWQKTLESFQEITKSELYQQLRKLRSKILVEKKESVEIAFGGENLELSGSQRNSDKDPNHANNSLNRFNLASVSTSRTREQGQTNLKDGYSQDPKLRALQKSWRLISYYKNLKQALAEAEQNQSLKYVSEFLNSEEKPPVIEWNERCYLDEVCQNLEELSPEIVINSALKDYLLNDKTSKRFKTQCAEWLIKDQIPENSIEARNSGPQSIVGEHKKSASVNLQGIRDLLLDVPDSLVANNLTFSTLGKLCLLLSQSISSIFINNPPDNFPEVFEYQASNKTTLRCDMLDSRIEMLEAALPKLIQRSNKTSQIKIDLIAILVTSFVYISESNVYLPELNKIVETDDQKSKHIEQLTNILRALLPEKLDQKAKIYFEILHNYHDSWRRGLAFAIQDNEINEKLECVYNQEERQFLSNQFNQFLVSEFASNYTAKVDFERTIRRLKQAGFEIDLSAFREQIIDMLPTNLARILPDCRNAGINYPSAEHPGSSVTAFISDIPDARVFRTIKALEIAGVEGIQKAAEINWTKVDEREVVRHLSINLDKNRHCGWNMKLSFSGIIHDRDFVEPGQIVEFLRESAEKRPNSTEVINLIESMGIVNHPLNQAFSDLKTLYPQYWKAIISRIFDVPTSRNNSTDRHYEARARDEILSYIGVMLFRNIDPQVAYKLFLGLSEILMRPVMLGDEDDYAVMLNNARLGDMPIDNVAELLLKTDYKNFASEEFLNAWMQKNLGSEFKENEFSGKQEPRAQLYAILLVLIARESEDYHSSDLFKRIFSKFDTYGSWSGFRLNYIEQAGCARWATIWESYFSGISSSYKSNGALSKMRNEAELIARSIRRRSSKLPYASFRFQETSRIIARSSSGDFDQFCKYTTGDDPKHIDQKVLARSDRLMIRKYVDLEQAPVVLLVDADWLISGFEERRSLASVGETDCVHSNLRTLYHHLYLAQISKITPRLIIVARGHVIADYSQKEVEAIVNFQRIEEQESNYSRNYYFSNVKYLEEFLNMSLSGTSRLKLEEKIFGPTGLRAFSILEGGVISIKKGSEIVAFIHKRNLVPSISDLELLCRHSKAHLFIHKDQNSG